TPSRCPNSRLIVANIVSRSVRLLTSARTARLPAPSAFFAACSDPSFKPQMATRAPSLSNSCAAARPIPLLPPVIRIFLFASLPIVVTPLDYACPCRLHFGEIFTRTRIAPGPGFGFGNSRTARTSWGSPVRSKANAFITSAQLASEPPGADAHEEARQRDEGEEVRVDDVEARALDEHAARDRGEVRDGVEEREGLDPLRHRLDRRQPSGQH